jgi:hypothetical protein
MIDDDDFERRLAELRERRRGFPDGDRPFAAVLDALAWIYKADAEVTSVEALSAAGRPMADVKEEERRVESEELERAHEALPEFEDGLRSAQRAGGREIALDSRDPRQDRVADALIRYLVSTGFAAVRTEELGGDAFRYHIAVDWPRLDDLMARLGLPPLSQPTAAG